MMAIGKRFRYFLQGMLAIAVLTVGWVPDAQSGSERTPQTKTEYYENGVKKSEVEFVEGKKSGIVMNWYRTGCPMSLHHFEEDILDGPMIKWENCEDVIAIGEYRKGAPWKGYFLVNPGTATPITDIIVHESVLTYFVIGFHDGEAFSGLTKEQLKQQLDRNPVYRELLDEVESGSR